MKIYLITGFLGAGKSTYLNNLLTNADKKTGVLINEFGKISVDTITLQRNGIDLIELKNGSIFCACLKDKFIDGLLKLVKMPLDEIYIESSGLSDPSNMGSIAEILNKEAPESEFELAGVICLVDAVYFLQQLEVLESVRRQIIHSHFVIVNKIDLVDEERADKIKQTIKKINPKAKIELASFGKTKHNLMDVTSFYIPEEETTNTIAEKPLSMTLEFNNSPSAEKLKEFFVSCEGYLYRAKGYMKDDEGVLKLDVVNDMFTIEKVHTVIDVNSDELNQIVILASKGLKSLNHVSAAARNTFSDYKLYSS